MKPQGLEQQLAQARALHTSGDHVAAARLLKRLYKSQANAPQLLSVYGCFLKDIGCPAQAASLLERLVQLAPGTASHWLDLGSARQDSGCLEGALEAYRQAIAIDPSRWEVYLNLAFLLEVRADYAQAENFYRYAIRLKPDCVPAWSGLGETCLRLRRPSDAIPCFAEALNLAPSAELYCNLAQAQLLCRQYAGAAESARKATALHPRFALAHAHEARATMLQSRFVEAQRIFEIALEADANCASAMVGLANVHSILCNWEKSVYWFMRTLEGGSDSNQAVVHSSLLFTLTNMPSISSERLLEEHERWAALYGPPPVVATPVVPKSVVPEAGDAERKLRVGFVSGDFRVHSVRSFIAPILRGLDRGQFEVICYSTFAGADSATSELRALTDGWRDVARLTDDELAEQIESDRVDILVDLSGHTVGNRLLAFARKPAPVQVTYLGYANTTGLRAVDYWITDGVLHPAEMLHRTTEQIWRLPRCWTAYEPPAGAPEVADRDGTEPLTFVSFNHMWKLTSESLRLWRGVLDATPESKLLLKARGLNGDGERALIMERLAEAGIGAGRVTLLGDVESQREHLDLYRLADIALDPTPYSGGTTTAEALWMGVPVITLPGERMASRMSASMLDAAGLGEFIAKDENDFVRLAMELGRDGAKRSQLRKELRPRMAASPLCDGPGLARAMGEAFREMWKASLEPALVRAAI